MTLATKLRHLAAAALLLMVPAAHALLPYNDGDLILGVRASGGLGATTCYEVNIGSVTQFVGSPASFTVDLGGDITADLDLIFGSDWKTRGDVSWSISGTQYSAGNGFSNRTMFASKAQPTAGTQSIPWTRATLSTQGGPAGRIQALGLQYSNGTQAPGQTESTNSTKGLIQDTGKANSYAEHMPGGIQSTPGSSYAYFVSGAFGIENSFANGTLSSVLDLYHLAPGTNGLPGVFLGAFRLSDAGVLTFSPNAGDFAGPAQVAFSVAAQNVNEDDGTATLTINRTGNADSAFTLNFSTTDGTAVAGTDFTGQTNTAVAFAASEMSKTVDVVIADIAGFQGDRSFAATIDVASGNAQTIAPSTITVTIIDDDPQPSTFAFDSAAYQVAEDAASGKVTLTINRTGSTVGTASVNFSTTNGTALAGTDYTGQTNTVVNFADAQASASVDVSIVDRLGFFGNRTFTGTLSGATNGGTIGSPGSTTVTILETDTNPAGEIAFSAGAYSFASKDAGGAPNVIAIPLVRTNGTTGAVSVNVALAGGGNLDSGDFTFTSPTAVNFADGQDSATVNIPLTASAGPLPGAFNLALSNPTNGAVLGTIVNATITVTAPDRVPPKLKLTSPKGSKQGATFNVTGEVIEPDTVTRVEVTLNGGHVQTATLGANVNGVTSFSLTGLAAENGPNTLLVQAFDVNGTASKVTKTSFNYVNERPLLAGSYNGLITPTGAAAPGGNANNASGLFTATVSKTGSFTAKLLIGGTTISVKGVFANNGEARFSPSNATTLAVASKGKTPVQFGNLELVIDQPSAKITGTLGTASTVDADRAAFDGKTSLVDAAFLANKGKFTTVLPSEAQPVLTTALFPQGDGVGTITVSKTGKVSLVGKLADGSAIKAAATISKDYTFPLFAALYKNKGSLAGNVTMSLADIANANADSDLSADDMLWLRPADAKQKHYPAGWPDGVQVDLLAASFRAAQKGDATSAFPGLGADDLVNGNADVQFADGKLSSMIDVSVNIAVNNKVTNAPATDKSFKVSFSPTNGTVGGTFTHSDGSKPKFIAIIYQKGANPGAYGYFLSTVPKNAPSGEGGGVSIFAK